MNDAYLSMVRLRAIFVLACDLLCLHFAFAFVQTITWAHELDSMRAIPGLFPQAVSLWRPDEIIFALVIVASWAHGTTRHAQVPTRTVDEIGHVRGRTDPHRSP